MTTAQPILRFHAAGAWPPDAVAVERVPSTWRETRDLRAAIDAAWADATARLGRNLFDGQMCRLESWDAQPHRLTLRLAGTTYKTFLGTNLTHAHLADQLGPVALANPVGVSPALLTGDGFLMMGRRNDKVAYYPNRVHPFAGALDPDDPSPFDAVRREMNEELAFTPADVAEVRCTGIAEDLSIRQPELIFLARTPRTRPSVEAHLDHAEHRGTWSIPADEASVRRAIETADVGDGGFTPVAVASLLLFGRAEFGEQFFRESARRWA